MTSQVYTDDESYHFGHGRAYEKYGIAPSGCIVAIRPDGYVALLVGMDDMDRVTAFFSKVLTPGAQHRMTESTTVASTSLASNANSNSNNGFAAFPVYASDQATQGAAAA